MGGEPALDGVALAVLFLGAVLGSDHLGRQGQNLGVAGRHEAGAEKGMEELCGAIRAATFGALRAMDLARAVVLGAIERDQQASVQALERRQRIGGGEGLQGVEERSVERRRRGAVQHLSDVVVGRDRRHAEQRLAVRAAVALGQNALMRQERRAAHEEQRERRQADIRHRIGAGGRRSLAPIGKTGADRPQIRYQALQRAHAMGESCAAPASKPEKLDRVEDRTKNHHLWQIRLTPRPPPRVCRGPPPTRLRMRFVRI